MKTENIYSLCKKLFCFKNNRKDQVAIAGSEPSFNLIVKLELKLYKLYVVVNHYLVTLSFKFHEDPCTNARAQVVNACTRDKMCASAFTTHVRSIVHVNCESLITISQVKIKTSLSHLCTDLHEIFNFSTQDSD